MAERVAWQKVRLEHGGSLPQQHPVLELIGGPHPYIWVGDDNGLCFGHVDAKKAEKFARAVLRSTDSEAASG